jgi:hypothetical protein
MSRLFLSVEPKCLDIEDGNAPAAGAGDLRRQHRALLGMRVHRHGKCNTIHAAGPFNNRPRIDAPPVASIPHSLGGSM